MPSVYSTAKPTAEIICLPVTHTSVPVGYLYCDGSAVSRTTYAKLFASLGVTHGQGDGTTTFNIPDYRGRFLRGVDTSALNRDPDKAARTAINTGGNTGNAVGSVQTDAFQSHAHISYLAWGGNNNAVNAHGTVEGDLVGPNQNRETGNAIATTNLGTPRTSSETRPTNVSVNYFIKF